MIKSILQPSKPDANTSTSSKRSPLAFFVLIFVLSVPLWVAGFFVEVDGLPKNMQVTEPVLAFTPLAAASILVYGEEGLAGVGRLLKRIFDFPRIAHKVWYVPILFLMPFVYLLSYAGVRLLGISLPVQPHLPLVLIPVLFVVFFVGAAGEELGYMGYAAEPMQERWGALTAGIIMGSVWAVWHVPALIQSDQAPAYIAWGLLAGVGTRILIIWLYNNTGKSVFAGNLFHVMALFGSSFVATSASAPITAIVVVVVTFLWGSKTLARFRYADHRKGARGKEEKIVAH